MSENIRMQKKEAIENMRNVFVLFTYCFSQRRKCRKEKGDT